MLTALVVWGCGSGAESGANANGAGGSGASGGSETGGGGAANTVTVTIFHTNDEEGHLQPDAFSEPGTVIGGAANLAGWLAQDGFDPAHSLLLSGGDNWTGTRHLIVGRGSVRSGGLQRDGLRGERDRQP